MGMIIGTEPISVIEYLNTYTDIVNPLIKTTEELRETLDDNGYEELWDYPLNEIEHILDDRWVTDRRVVLVTDGVDFRWFEVE